MRIEGIDKSWTEALELLTDLHIEEGIISRDSGAVSIKHMDDSYVALAEITLEREGLEEEEPEEIGVNFERLLSALNSYGSYPEANIETGDGTARITTDSRTYDHAIALPLLDVQREELPDLKENIDTEQMAEFEGKISTPMNRAEKIFGSIENFLFDTEGGDLYIKLRKDYADPFKEKLTSIDDDVEAVFSHDYLKALKGEWNFQIGTDLPLIATKTASGSEWEGEFEVAIAPRVEA